MAGKYDSLDSQQQSRRRQLPIELIDMIITCLEGGLKYDRAGLKAYSLVSRAWNELCRPRIFRKLVVLLGDTYFPLRRLSFLHFTAPHLCKYISELSIQVTRYTQDTPSWISLVFPLFVKVRSIELSIQPRSTRPMLPEPFAAGIMNLLAKVPLKKLRINGPEIMEDSSDLWPLLAASACTLEVLVLDERSFAGQGIMAKPIPPHSVVRMVALRSLRLSSTKSRPILINGLKQLDVPNLDSLTCRYVSGDPFRVLSSQIPATMSTLTLRVHPDSDIPCFGQTVRPSCLTISIEQNPAEQPHLPLQTWIRGCLTNLPFPNELRRLNINTYGNYFASASGTRNLMVMGFPARTYYELLCHALRPLLNHGKLEHIILTYDLSWMPLRVLRIPEDRSGEAGMLDEVFAPLLEVCQPGIDIILKHRGQTWEEKVVFLRHHVQSASTISVERPEGYEI